jgi:hypothetical protein
MPVLTVYEEGFNALAEDIQTKSLIKTLGVSGQTIATYRRENKAPADKMEALRAYIRSLADKLPEA